MSVGLSLGDFQESLTMVVLTLIILISNIFFNICKQEIRAVAWKPHDAAVNSDMCCV